MESLYERMKDKLSKTTESFVSSVNNALTAKEYDEDFFEELEETLLLADFGMDTTLEIVETLRKNLKEKSIKRKEEVTTELRQIISDMVNLPIVPLQTPAILLVVGVNGVGKTTSIAKLASIYKNQDLSVMVVAGDTFRAAANEQLDTWSQRIGVDIVKSAQGADPSSVLFDAIQAARARKTDIVICDTAGRLHNKVNLMKELEKMKRIIDREGEGFHKHHLLVLDATTGQNAVNQAKTFNEAIDISGIIITKMDGTAKGGVVVPILNELSIPIEYIGIGEGANDLIEFEPSTFISLLFG
ncbi:MAG: signal recognition particle-docking protein FtsY [Eubacteriaceae bacterium]|jgi:fused signal recognition particle receptor|nr:signal recognition particle-docking protein FtsY [Eubacteriaceae bacterium]